MPVFKKGSKVWVQGEVDWCSCLYAAVKFKRGIPHVIALPSDEVYAAPIPDDITDDMAKRACEAFHRASNNPPVTSGQHNTFSGPRQVPPFWYDVPTWKAILRAALTPPPPVPDIVERLRTAPEGERARDLMAEAAETIERLRKKEPSQ